MTTRAVRPLLMGALASCCILLVLATAGYGAKTPKAGPPSVLTGGVHVQGASTTLLGSVNPRGAATSYFFEYGPTIAYGKRTNPGNLSAGMSTVKIGQAATGLLPGYHYRLVANNSFATRYGRDRTFTTRAAKRGKFNLNKLKEPTVYGGSLVLSGALTGVGNVGRQLELQASPYPYLTSFQTVGAPVTTGAGGSFSFHVPRLLTSTQYRVGTLDPRPQYSATITAQVAYRVTLKVKTSKHRGLVRLYGTITPAVVGARVQFQLSKKVRPGKTEKTEERTTRFSSQFSTTSKRGTKTLSRFSEVVKVLKGGSYRAQVQPTKKGPFVAGNSPTVLLHGAGK